MGILVAILLVAALLLGFLWLTTLEKKRGRRIFEGLRSALDTKTETAVRYATSETTHASFRESVRRSVDHVVHEVVHTVLLVVRFVERTLTRLAREIRGRRAKENENSVQ